MPSGILRILVFLAATGVIAAATHANVPHAGGYGSQDAPLIIALAVLLALGMAFVGVCFNEGKRGLAILLAILILAGEAYWVLVNAEREVANLDAASAPVAELQSARASAQARVDKAEAAKRQAEAAAISEAAKKDCASNCAKLLLVGQEQAARELDAARAALARLPEPRSVTPLSDPSRHPAVGLAASPSGPAVARHHRGLASHRRGIASEARGSASEDRGADAARDRETGPSSNHTAASQ